MPEPLVRRREVLVQACQKLDEVDVLFSEGVVGQSKAFYAAMVDQGHEGVMAKHPASKYRPGRRCGAWLKIKPWPKGTGSGCRISTY
jgi:ATP-dependent DNA ligase